jgi:hypothetical protein
MNLIVIILLGYSIFNPTRIAYRVRCCVLDLIYEFSRVRVLIVLLYGLINYFSPGFYITLTESCVWKS